MDDQQGDGPVFIVRDDARRVCCAEPWLSAPRAREFVIGRVLLAFGGMRL